MQHTYIYTYTLHIFIFEIGPLAYFCFPTNKTGNGCIKKEKKSVV